MKCFLRMFLTCIFISSIAFEPITCTAFGTHQIIQSARTIFKHPWMNTIGPMLAGEAIIGLAALAFVQTRSIMAAHATRSKALQNRPARYCTQDEGLIAPETVPQEIQYYIDMLKNPGRLISKNCSSIRGLLLTGPNGIGKSQLARYIAKESGCKYIYEPASALLGTSQNSGAQSIAGLIARAKQLSWKESINLTFNKIGSLLHITQPVQKKPVIIILDEIDSIATPRFATDAKEPRYFDKNLVTSDKSSALGLLLNETDSGDHYIIPDIFFIYCSNKKACELSTAFNRVGRMDVLEIPALTPAKRAAIIKFHVARLTNCSLADDLKDQKLINFVKSPSASQASGDVLSKALRNVVIKAANQQHIKITAAMLMREIDEIITIRKSKLDILNSCVTEENGYKWGSGLASDSARHHFIQKNDQLIEQFTNQEFEQVLDAVVDEQKENKTIDAQRLNDQLHKKLEERETTV